MKIFYIAKFPNVYDEESIAKGFEELGHTVVRVNEQAYSNYDYIRMIEKEQPDFVLCAKLEVKDGGKKLIELLKQRKIKTVSWTFDLYMGYVREKLIKDSPFFWTDYVFTSDGGHEKEFKEMGINHFVLRQGIGKEYNYLVAKEEKYKHDLVFVGGVNHHYQYRQEMLAFLKKSYNLKWYGMRNTWEIRGHELNKLYSSAKIIIGDSVYSPHYWSNRIYETIGRGGFIIHPEIEGLDKEFIPYKHYVPYKIGDFEGLRKKIDYYLKNKEKRDKIRIVGMNYCNKKYNYKKRCQKMLEVLSERTIQG